MLNNRILNRLKIVSIFAAIVCFSRQLNAAVIIDFNSISVGTANVNIAGPYVEDLYRFDVTPISWRPSAFYMFGTSDPGFTGTKALTFGVQGEPIFNLARADGHPFDFISIDIWEYRNVPAFLSVFRGNPTFTGYKSDLSVVQQSILVDQVWGAETFAFPNFTNVTRVEWSLNPTNGNAFSGFHQFDNIVVSTVPEPSTLLLTSMGLGGFACLTFIRKRCRPVVNV